MVCVFVHGYPRVYPPCARLQMPVSAALVAAPVEAPGGDEEQAAEGDEEEELKETRG